MNEQISSDQQNIETMASQLAKRRLRLVVLNFLILLIPLVAGAAFLIFGKTDRQWVAETVIKTVEATVPPKVDDTVPPAVKKTLEQNRVVERIAELERRLGVSPAAATSSPEPTVATTTPRTLPAPADQTSQDLLNRVRHLEGVELRLATVERGVEDLTNPDSEKGLPALWATVGTLGSTQSNQQTLLQEHTASLHELEQLRVIQRLGEAEQALGNIPTDLRQQLGRIQSVDQRVLSLENERLADKIRAATADMEKNIQALENRQKNELANESKRVDRKLGEIEQSAFRSTLTRENSRVTISTLDFEVVTGEFTQLRTQGAQSYLTKLTVRPPGGPTISLRTPFPVDQPGSFSLGNCNFEITVRRITDIPGIDDYMELLMERKCPQK